jgi:hypothetical protein
MSSIVAPQDKSIVSTALEKKKVFIL